MCPTASFCAFTAEKHRIDVLQLYLMEFRMTQSSQIDHTCTMTERRNTRVILAITFIALVTWGLAIAKWGLPALFLPAVCLVPILMFLLVLISRG